MYEGEEAAESNQEVQAGTEMEESGAALYKAFINRSADTAVTDWLTAVIDAVVNSIEWGPESKSGFCAEKCL